MSFSTSGSGNPDGFDQPHREPGGGRQGKAVQQKQYRDREGELFQLLRSYIANLTGREPANRHETLSGASELLMRLHRENTTLRVQANASLPGSASHINGPAPYTGPSYTSPPAVQMYNPTPNASSGSSTGMPEIDYLMQITDDNGRGDSPYNTSNDYYRNTPRR